MIEWVNEAAMPVQPDQGAEPVGSFAVREQRQQAVIRRRVLTAAGNAVALPVTTSATSVTVTFARVEIDANYGVVVTPNWNTSVWVPTKTTTGYVVHFGTGAPTSATADVTTFRSES